MDFEEIPEILPPAPQPAEPVPKKRRQRRTLTATQLEDGYGVNTRGEDRYKIRYQRPEVAKHIAKVLVSHNMDWDAATAKMLNTAAKTNNWDPPTEEAIIRHSQLLQRAPQIQTALREYLSVIGIDDKAHKIYTSVLWGTYLDRRGSDARWSTACKQLGAMMQVDKKTPDTPVPLPLVGAEGMLKRMGIPVNDKLEPDDARIPERSEPEEAEADLDADAFPPANAPEPDAAGAEPEQTDEA